MSKVDQKQNWLKLKSVQTLLRFACLADRKSYVVIIYDNSCAKFTKSEIWVKLKSVQTWLRIACLADRKSYVVIYVPSHVKSWPKAKLGQVEVGSNIAQNHLLGIGSHMWSLYMPMHVQSWPKAKFGQVEVGSNIAQNRLFGRSQTHYLVEYIEQLTTHTVLGNIHRLASRKHTTWKHIWNRWPHIQYLETYIYIYWLAADALLGWIYWTYDHTYSTWKHI